MKNPVKKPSWWDEFAAFAIKGNAMALAVGTIIGAAFSTITKSLTDDIIMPIVSIFLGGVDFSEMKLVLPRLFGEPVVDDAGNVILNTLNYGNFISAVINFLILALVVFFLVKSLTKLTELGKKKDEAAPAEPRTEAQITADLERQRAELAATIDQLYARVQPAALAQEAKEEAIKCLKQVNIPNPEERAKQYPHEFSGGMRQRAMIAMALSCNPKLLIADEPTTALDVTIQAQILKLMNDLKREHGTSILFITHDLGVIAQMADDVAVMYCGQVVEMAPAKTLFTDCEFSHPYTEGLMVSIPRLDTPAGVRLEPIPGSVPHPLNLPKGCKFAPRCKYCQQRCLEEEPELVNVTEEQQVRCFYPRKEERRANLK